MGRKEERRRDHISLDCASIVLTWCQNRLDIFVTIIMVRAASDGQA